MAKSKRVTIPESPFAKTDRAPTSATTAARSDRRQQAAAKESSAATSPPGEGEGGVTDKVRAVSVSLRESEYAAYDEIAAGMNPQATRMAVMNEALRIFVRMYRAGKIKIASGIEGGRVIVRESK